MTRTKDVFPNLPLKENNIMIVLRLRDTILGVTMYAETEIGIIAAIVMFVTTKVMILNAAY